MHVHYNIVHGPLIKLPNFPLLREPCKLNCIWGNETQSASINSIVNSIANGMLIGVIVGHSSIMLWAHGSIGLMRQVRMGI